MARSISNPPLEGSSLARITFDTQVKELVEVLAGQRGSASEAAVIKGSISINVPNMTRTAPTAQGTVIQTADGLIMAQGADYLKLVEDMRAVINDNVNLRNTIAALVSQLKG